MKHQLDATLCRFYFCRVTLHVSDASSHHQEYLKLVRRPLVRVLSLQVSHHISLLGPKLQPAQCCIKLVFHLTYTMMHGNTKLKLSSAVFGQKLLHKMWSVCGRIVVVQDTAIFSGRFHELIHANVARPLRRITFNCFPVGSVLVVYDALRIKKTSVTWPLFCFVPGASSLVAGTWYPSTVTIVLSPGHNRRPSTRHLSQRS